MLDAAKSVEEFVVRIRRDLHEHPEIGLQEKRTMKLVVTELAALGLEAEIVQDGGIIAIIEGARPGKSLILRADLDALPIEEAQNNLKQKKVVVSKTKAAAHLCGHDGHTAMLLGVAKILMDYRAEIKGRVILAFEQAEETGQGIFRLLQRLVEIGADGVWGIHLKSDIPSGKISVDPGPRMAGVFPFDVKLKGLGGHGSRPDLAHSPIDCFHDFYQQLQIQSRRIIHPFAPATFSIGSVQAGSIHSANVIPNELRFNGTGRFLHEPTGNALEAMFTSALETACQQNNCTYKLLRPLRALPMFVYNDEHYAEMAKNAVISSMGEESLIHYPAWMASEPFAYYQKYFPGVFAFVGIENKQQGIGAEHHNPHFDLDEDVLHLGVALTLTYTFDFLRDHTKSDFNRETRSVQTFFEDIGFV